MSEQIRYFEANIAKGWHYSNCDDALDSFHFRLPCANCNMDCNLENVEFDNVPEKICKAVNATMKFLKDEYEQDYQYCISHPIKESKSESGEISNVKNLKSCWFMIDIDPRRIFDKSKFLKFFKQFEK